MAFSCHTVGLKKNGTCIAVGSNHDGQCNIQGWRDIVQVVSGGEHTVGLKKDGTVVAVGWNYYGQCNIQDWRDIVQVDVGRYYTVGLKKDCTVVAVGSNESHQCDVGGWSDIIQVSCGDDHTVGLKKDGTCVAVGPSRNNYGKLNVQKWKGIVQVSSGRLCTIGVKKDGTCTNVGFNYEGLLNVQSWTDIIQVSCGNDHVIGLKKDGTCVAAGGDNGYGQSDVSDWKDIVQISCGYGHTVGLKKDGTVVAVGHNKYGQVNNVSDWGNIVSISNNFTIDIEYPKLLLKKFNQYYTIKPQFYNISTGKYEPCGNKFEDFGFEDLNELIKKIDEITIKGKKSIANDVSVFEVDLSNQLKSVRNPFTFTKVLIEKNLKYYTIKDNQLFLLENQNLNKSNFETNGFAKLSLLDNIDKDKLKLIIYDESNPYELNLKYELKESFRPIDKFEGKIKILKQEMK